MSMILYRYTHFINESEDFPKSDLKNAKQKYKVVFSKEFKTVLSKIKSPLAKSILDLKGSSLDIAQNYIDICRDKDDTITYIQNNRVKDSDFDRYQVTEPREFLAAEKIYMMLGLPRPTRMTPYRGTVVKIHQIIKQDEIRKFYGSHRGDVFWWKSDSGGNHFSVKKDDYPFGVAKLKFPSLKGSEFKVGRFARRILEAAGLEVNDKEIEIFVNQYKSEIAKLNDIFANFRIVEGEDLRMWYREDKYSPGEGPLNGSCMRYSKCQQFMDIYVKNSDKIKMLILLDDIDPNKIVGRALVWKLDDGSTFMDRIYYIRDSTINVFKDYAISKEWKYKKDQNNSSNTPIMLGESVSKEQKLKITLPELNYKFFPYVDTIKFMNRGTVKSSQVSTDVVLTNYEGKYVLENTNGRGGGGACERCGGTQVIECDNCSGDGYFRCEECDGSGMMSCNYCNGGMSTCGTCRGSGKVVDGVNEIDCPTCKGSKQTVCKRCGGEGERKCSYCRGGRVTCSDCDGAGEIDCPNC